MVGPPDPPPDGGAPPAPGPPGKPPGIPPGIPPGMPPRNNITLNRRHSHFLMYKGPKSKGCFKTRMSSYSQIE